MAEKLQGEVKMKDLVKAHNDLLDLYNALVHEVAALTASKDRRGPKSQKEMTDDDARRLLYGDLAAVPHKEAAEALGYSYAQVYSMRKEYTFKHIHKEWKVILDNRRKEREAAKANSNPENL